MAKDGAPCSLFRAEDFYLLAYANIASDAQLPQAVLGKGTNPNMVGRLDENLAQPPLVDVVAGIPDFSSTRVTIEKII